MVQNTWKLPDISSLHNADRTGIISFETMQTFISSKGYLITDQSALQARGRRPRLAGPSGAQRQSRDSVKTNQPNRFAIGGAYRDRTDDPLLAKQVLSQLS